MTHRVTLDRLGAYVIGRTKKQTEAAVEAVRQTMAQEGQRLIQEAISGAKPLPVDRGTYRRSWRTQNVRGGAKLFNPTIQAAVIEEGRRKGARQPPADVIGEWARRKGLLRGVKRAERPAAQRALGFVIARAIAKRGLPKRRILASIIPELRRRVQAAVQAALVRG